MVKLCGLDEEYKNTAFISFVDAGQYIYRVYYGGANVDNYKSILGSFVSNKTTGETKIPDEMPFPDNRECYMAIGSGDISCSYQDANDNDCCDDYNNPDVPNWTCSKGDQTNTEYGNCVWWGAHERPDVGSVAWVPGDGSADRWDNHASEAGFLVDDCTRAGDIYVCDGSCGGHVAYVTSTNETSVNVSEMNWCSTCMQNTSYNSDDRKFIHTTNSEIVFYWDSQYACNGRRQVWGTDTGTYNMAGWFDNQATGVSVPNGWAVKVFSGSDGTGNSLCLTASDANFSDNVYTNTSTSVNDSISSYTVYHDSNCSLPVNLVLENQTIMSEQIYEALESITGKNNFIVDDTGNVTFRAGEKIILQPGFQAENGSDFHAEINESL